jgi:hypothetical protein
MDSNLNYRHVQVHSGDLQRRAELHRLAAESRRSRNGRAAASTERFHVISLEAIRSSMARLRRPAAPTSGRPA